MAKRSAGAATESAEKVHAGAGSTTAHDSCRARTWTRANGALRAHVNQQLLAIVLPNTSPPLRDRRARE